MVIDMRKKGFAVLLAVLLLAGILGVVVFASPEENVTTFWFGEEIHVVDGVADITEHSIPFDLAEDGTYVVKVKWENEKAGLVSGIALRNEAGEIVFFCTGDTVNAESTEMELKAGTYQAQYLYFTNLEELMEAAALADEVTYDNMQEFAIEGNETYEMTYHFNISRIRSTEYNLGLLCGMLVGVVCGLVVVMLMFKYVKVKKDGSSFEYDERQQVARGNGFKYGYITSIIYNAVLCFIAMLGNPLPIDMSVLILAGILLSILVYVVYCIQHDAYVSLNENANRLMVVFAIIGGVNSLIGIIHIMEGTMIEDGMITFRCMNLLCGIMMLAVTGILFVHTKLQARDED